jgi:Icc-related predicted phosphoesterase
MSCNITHISDTHGYHQRIKLIGGDILIHSGDILDFKEKISIEETIEWIDKTPYEYKIIVLGNHDEELLKFKLPNKTILLNNELISIFDIKFYGLSATLKEINPKCFNESTELEIENELKNENFDILITHGPPKGILDNKFNNNIGSASLLDYVKKHNPKYHLFGHAHHLKGTYNNGLTTFSNASIVYMLGKEIVNGIPYNFIF